MVDAENVLLRPEDDRAPGPADAEVRRERAEEPVATGPATWLTAREAVALCVAPVVAFFVYGIHPFYQQNGVDPFVYTGYAVNSTDLVNRFGYPYFAVRFGLLWPMSAFNAVLGGRAGYYGLRWVLAVLASTGLYVLFRRIGSRAVGGVIVAIFLLNPITIHAVMTVYSDTVGVAYLAAAWALLLLPTGPRGRLASCLIAGLLLGLTVNANLFIALPVTAALAFWLAVRLFRRGLKAFAEIGALATGVVVITVAGAIYYGVKFGDYNILRPSIDAARQLSDITTADRAPNRDWLNFRPYLWLPVVAPIALVTVRVTQGRALRWFESAAAGMLALAWSVYLVQEFLLGGYLLETYFYTSYMFGPTLIVLGFVVAAIVGDRPERRVVISVAAAGVVLFPFVWRLLLQDLAVWTFPSLVGVVAIAGGCYAVGRNRPAFLAVAVAIAAITPSLVTLAAPSNVPLAEGQPYRREPNYDQALFNRDDSLLDVYQLAIAFADIVPREASDPGTVVFWYADQDDRAALVESTYLWHYNTVQVMPPGMPTLTDDQARELTGRTPRFLVLMGSDPSVVASGRRALDGLGLQHVSSEERVLRRGEASLTVDIEELVPAPCDGSTKGRLEVWALQPTCAPR